MPSGAALSWRQYRAILRKDIVMELRTKEMVTSMGIYALLTMVIYQVACLRRVPRLIHVT